jgi:hypothetical protein
MGKKNHPATFELFKHQDSTNPQPEIKFEALERPFHHSPLWIWLLSLGFRS